MTIQPVTFVHITDTHFGPTPGYARHGRVALPAAQRLIDTLNTLPITPDFAIHTGDVVTTPDPNAYALAAATLADLRIPTYYVCGNHDDPPGLRANLVMGPKQDLTTDADTLCYAFEVRGVRFLVLDTHGPPDMDPRGVLSTQQMDILRAETTPVGPPLVIFLHHPLLPLDSPWMDQNMLVENGGDVHEALLPARDRIRGVFYGHIHQSLQIWRDGILYVAGASSFAQFSSWPSDETVGYVPQEAPGYNFVRVLPRQLMIRQHRLSSS